MRRVSRMVSSSGEGVCDAGACTNEWLHDDPNTRELAVTALRSAFLEVVASKTRSRHWMQSKAIPASACWSPGKQRL